jgi:Mg/Co/Ni transporter MgtE
MRVRDVVARDRPFVTIPSSMSVPALLACIEQAADQDVFPVLGDDGRLAGLIAAESLRVVASNPELHRVAVAVDLMSAAASIGMDDELRVVAEQMLQRDLRAVPVIEDGAVVALLDQHDIARAAMRPTDPNESMVFSPRRRGP